jgi:hypothetical protein
MRLNLIVLTLVSSLSLVASAQAPIAVEKPLADTWSNRASFFIGARGGVAFPPGAVGLAPNATIELGVAPPQGFGFGVRAMWMNNPPGVPFLGLKPAEYGFGALADFRYYIETIDPLIIYPTIAVGFLAGPERGTMQNAVLPLLNIGVGAKVKFGNLYASFEFGVSGFTIPYVGIAIGYEGDSKRTKQAERLRIAAETAPVPAPAAAPAPASAPAPVAPATTP